VLLLLCQVAKAVEDILYAATQEEGEAHLAAAIAELEVRDEHEQELVSVFVCGLREIIAACMLIRIRPRCVCWGGGGHGLGGGDAWAVCAGQPSAVKGRGDGQSGGVW
jgi:hypothetical protein